MNLACGFAQIDSFDSHGVNTLFIWQFMQVFVDRLEHLARASIEWDVLFCKVTRCTAHSVYPDQVESVVFDSVIHTFQFTIGRLMLEDMKRQCRCSCV